MRKISKVLLGIKSIALIECLLMLLLVATGNASAMICGSGTLKPVCECGDTAKGDFTLDEDLICPYGHGLIIGADGITIDGNGYMVDGVDPGKCGGSKRSGIWSLGYDGITIENLEITNFCYGIHLEVDEYLGRGYNDQITIENCKVHDNGYMEVPGDPTVGSMATHGLKLHGVSDSVITNNEVSDQRGSGGSCEGGGNGIFLRGVDGRGHAENNIITGNKLHHNTKGGFFTKMMAEYDTVSYNEVWENGQGGIILRCMKSAHFTIEENDVHDNYGTGIWIGGPGNTIKSNTVTNNRDGGPYVGDAVGGRGTGIKIGRCNEHSGHETIEDNTVCENDYVDIYAEKECNDITGENNKCDTVVDYHDNGVVIGCDHWCGKRCWEGTPYGKCSIYKPEYCDNGVLIYNCALCGCLGNLICNMTSGECEGNKCVAENGHETPYGYCSVDKPWFCDNGELIEKCTVCDCPERPAGEILLCNEKTDRCRRCMCKYDGEEVTPCGLCSKDPSEGGRGAPWECNRVGDWVQNCGKCCCREGKCCDKASGTCHPCRDCPDGKHHEFCYPDDKPKQCYDGTIIDSCDVCGCPPGMECDIETGLCIGEEEGISGGGGESTTTPTPAPTPTPTPTATTATNVTTTPVPEGNIPSEGETAATEGVTAITGVYARFSPLDGQKPLIFSEITAIAQISPLKIQIPSSNITTDAQTSPVEEVPFSNITATSRLPPENRISSNLTTTARTLSIETLPPNVTTISRLSESQIPSSLTSTARTLPKREKQKNYKKDVGR